MASNSREAGIRSAGRVEVVHEKDNITKICELLRISAHKRADRPRGAVDDEQRRKFSGPLRFIDHHSYVLVLRAVRMHYRLDEQLKVEDTEDTEVHSSIRYSVTPVYPN